MLFCTKYSVESIDTIFICAGEYGASEFHFIPAIKRAKLLPVISVRFVYSLPCSWEFFFTKGAANCYHFHPFIIPFFLSGCRGLNPIYQTPSLVYYPYTTSRRFCYYKSEIKIYTFVFASVFKHFVHARTRSPEASFVFWRFGYLRLQFVGL